MDSTVLVVLGDCRLDHSASGAAITGAQRRLLQRLALSAPQGVRLDDLARAIWEVEPPNHLRATIQNQVSRIRAAHGEGVVATTVDGYRLGVPTDAQLLERRCVLAEQRLAEGDAQSAYDLADAAVAGGSERAFPDLDHVPGVSAARRVVAAAHRSAQLVRLEAALQMGRHAWALVEAERLAADDPLDERRQALLARALNLAGRRGDALAVVLRARRALRETLGIDGGPLLQEAEEEALRPGAGGRPTVLGEFVGRETEVRTALAAVARDGVVEVIGEPGIGVSRVLERIGSQLRTLGVRAPVVSALEHQDAAAGVLRAVLQELGVDPGPRGPVAGFVPALATAAAQAPVTIVVDDTELVGPAARQTLAAAIELSDVSLVLGGHRTTWASTADRVVLGPLDRAQVAAIAAAVAGAPSADDLDRLVADSGGNPAVLQILLTEAADRPGGGGSLRSLVDHLLADLDPLARAFVERAAVAGDRYPWALLDPPREPPLHLVSPRADGSVQFRHGAVREELVNRMVPARREELHLRLGQAAHEAEAPGHLVARHLLAAGSLAGDRVVDACRRAALESTLHGAHVDAVAWLTAALETETATTSDRVRLRVELGDAQRLAGHPEHLATLRGALLTAIELKHEELVSAACFAFLQLGGTTGTGAPHAELDQLLEQALAEVTSPSRRAPVLAAASLAWSLTGHAERSRDLFDEAERLATDPDDRARVLPFAYMAWGLPGDSTRRRAASQELLRLASRSGVAASAFEGWQLAYSVALEEADGAAVRESVARMGDLVGEVGDVGRRWAHHFALAALAHLEGRDDDAERLAEEARVLFAPVSESRALAAHLGQLFGLRLTQGRVADLVEPLEWLVGEQPGVPAWHAAYALSAAAAGGEPSLVVEHVRLAGNLAQDDLTWLAGHVVAARAVAVIDDRAQAAPLLARLHPWSGRAVWQGTCSYGPVDTALALLHRCLGDEQAAGHHLTVARDVCGRLGAPAFLDEIERWERERPGARVADC